MKIVEQETLPLQVSLTLGLHFFQPNVASMLRTNLASLFAILATLISATTMSCLSPVAHLLTKLRI